MRFRGSFRLAVDGWLGAPFMHKVGTLVLSGAFFERFAQQDVLCVAVTDVAVVSRGHVRSVTGVDIVMDVAQCFAWSVE